MATSRNIHSALLDAATELKDAGAVTGDGAGQVGGAPRVVNVGLGLMQAVLVVDVNGLTTGGASAETYDIVLQGSTDATFQTGVEELTRIRADAANDVGRHTRQVTNGASNGELMPYLRVYADVGGTAPSINYRAYLTISPLR